MSLLSQFYPQGGGTSPFSGMRAFGETINVYPGFICFRGSVDTLLPYPSNADVTADVQQLIFYSGVEVGGGSALIFRRVSWKGTLELRNDGRNTPGPDIISGLYHAGNGQTVNFSVKVTDSVGTTSILDNCHLASPTVELIMPGLVDTTTSLIVPQNSFNNPFQSFNDGKAFAVKIQNAALNAASVNKILIDSSEVLIHGAATTIRYIDLSGGSSAGTSDLTTAGAAALATLQAKGFSVTLNP